eukprot:12907488-Prorocentrum_lima.AAC.1
MSTAALKFCQPVKFVEHPYRRQDDVASLNSNRGTKPEFHDEQLVAKGTFWHVLPSGGSSYHDA